ncbi:hypothetical protein [Lentzea sp. E54]
MRSHNASIPAVVPGVVSATSRPETLTLAGSGDVLREGHRFPAGQG